MKTEPRTIDAALACITDFGNETKEFDLAFPPGTSAAFIPGQFAVVLCPADGKVVRRAYSIASPPKESGHVALVIKRVEGGRVTRWFWSLKTGDTVRLHLPFGKFILPDPVGFDILFVAVGTGIAPFRSMILEMLPAGFPGKIALLFGTRYDDQIPYHDEFRRLAAGHPNFTYIPTISRPGPFWKGESGYVQTKIEKFFPDPARRRIYICGLNDMIQAVQDAAIKLGYAKEQIHFEKYD